MTNYVRLPYILLITFVFIPVFIYAQIPLSLNSMGNAFYNPPERMSFNLPFFDDDNVNHSCRVGSSCSHCSHWFNENDACDSNKELPIYHCNSQGIIEQDSDAYLICNEKKRLEAKICPIGSIFKENNGCQDPTKVTFRQSAVTEINPNQPGCTYDVQCSAVWPNAKCNVDSGIGTCRCPENTHVARETRDGWVCVSLKDQGTGGTSPLYFICPLPEGAGFKIALNDPAPQFGSFPVGCTTGSSATVEPVAGLHGGASCIWPSTGEFVGDLYDCIHTAPSVKLQAQFPQSQYAPSADGVCCPSRALSCVQPQVTGPNPTEPRWWYNSVTGTCQQFLWDPAATQAQFHSANNFRTIDHCESYCRDTCTRGSPQYTNEANVYAERPIHGCSTSITCANEYQCTAVGSQHLCCPTPSAICSTKGGRTLDLHPRTTPYHPGFTSHTSKENVRFYYDVSSGRCQDFVYKGNGGNYNNFLSKHECEMFCARLQCDRGTPLKIGEESQRCQSNSQCPSSHECKADQGVCCPRKQTICSQPLRVGDCTENVKRYWYNAVSRQCQMFEFTGCQGNDNNFDTILECQNFCKNAIPEPRCMQGQAYKDTFGNFVQCNHGASNCPPNYECYFDGNLWGCCPTKSYTCSLTQDSGVQCGAGTTFKYYYNTQTQACDSFQYNGCDGNSNNFASRDTCEEFCGVGGCPHGGLPMRDHTGQLMVCTSQEVCPSSHECTTVFVSSNTINRCCPTKAHVCSLPPLQGTLCGSHQLTRYYFNIVTGQCSPFQYNGCDACPAGSVVYMDPNDHKPILCNEALKNSCPPNYACTFNALLNNYVCCGSTDMGVCPDGEKAYVNAFDMTAKECMINMEGSCPSNYLCRFNLQRNKYYCCSSVNGRTCPVGKFLYRDPRHGNSIRCTIGKEMCPDGYSCQSYLKGSFQGFCCSATTICPDEAEFLVDESSQQPRICTMGAFVSCPNGYTCRATHASNEGFCCRGHVVSVNDGCPPGNFVYMVNNEIANCDPFNPPNAPCPGGYTCQWSTANQRYQCCGNRPLPVPEKKKDGCPPSQIAFQDGDAARVCTAGGQTCPVGYFCQFSSSNNQFQCCGVSAGCPNDQVAFIGLRGEPEKCLPTSPTCPHGYTCQKTLSSQHICCTVRVQSKDCSLEKVFVDGLCLRKAEPGEECTHNKQCNGGSICEEGKCICANNMQLNGKYCQPIPTCNEKQILLDGICQNLVQIGERCLSSRQCPETSYCISGRCNCKRGHIEENGKCVLEEEVETKPTRPKVNSKPKPLITKCFNPSLSAYRDPVTDRVQFCSPMTSNCPENYYCQLNAVKQQYICCGIPEGRKNGVLHTRDVCPRGRIPYLLNGQPQKCSKARCPKGYQCVYNGHDYFCCSHNNAASSFTKPKIIANKNDQCPWGASLIYPATHTPVTCDPRVKTCPLGYSCERSRSGRSFICCSLRLRDDIGQHGCPHNTVQVQRLVSEGVIQRRCERACPPHSRPIGGVCYEVADDQA
uniref:BPTI/Kunitz inhibitor domain-containing protein n=1 Tax=Panagrolaimus superbus TaxID=310955 RepID=A0A914YYM5_9BILA